MCFFCYCSRLCVTQKQLLLEFEMCNVMFVSTILKNISEGRRSGTRILELKKINVERVKIFSVLTVSLTNLRHMMLHWIESKSFWWKRIRIWKKYALYNLLQFRPKKKKQTDRRHTSITLHTSPRISTEYIVHFRFSTEMAKNTNAHTQRHYHDQLSADENKSSTARTSIHPTQEGHLQLSTDVTANMHTHMRSARATLEWRVSSFFLLTGPPLTRVESLIRKTNIRAHVYCEKRHEQWKKMSCHVHVQGKLRWKLAAFQTTNSHLLVRLNRMMKVCLS